MKIYLDDTRSTPDGWERYWWPDEVIAFIRLGVVTHVSLDHDLGDDERGTGYDVLAWIEEEVATKGLKPPGIWIHTDNPAARLRMLAAVKAIRILFEDAPDPDPCDSCDWMMWAPHHGHCHRFKARPDGVCGQHQNKI